MTRSVPPRLSRPVPVVATGGASSFVEVVQWAVLHEDARVLVVGARWISRAQRRDQVGHVPTEVEAGEEQRLHAFQ